MNDREFLGGIDRIDGECETNTLTGCGCIAILAAVMAAGTLLLLTCGCSSHKSAVVDTVQQQSASAGSEVATATDDRVRWFNSLSLELDSFELVLPLPLLPDTATVLPVDGKTMAQGQPRALVLRAKHAAVGKAQEMERSTATVTCKHDTVAVQSSAQVHEDKEVQTTAVTKPPNANWAITLIIVGGFALLAFFLYRKMK